ncbi:MAG: tRNA 4-thiouridine(8) synthase ThiI [Myxococcales bacterium]|nr:tRNA 4-thiouridine(8) synthase ThiI [Myxococcales bacterium]
MTNEQRVVIARLGEVFLKGRNRGEFVRRLRENMQRALRDISPLRLDRAQGRIYVHVEAEDAERAARAVRDTFGVGTISVARPCERSLEAIYEAAALAVAEATRGRTHATFKVQTKRPDKTFTPDSMEVSRLVGGALLERFDNLRVDVKTPELVVGVEIGTEHALVFCGREQAVGGLPVGCEGDVLLLLSGGIDSPVAGHLMQRRGCRLAAVYFHSPPYVSEHARDKVLQLARRLARAQGPLEVDVVRFTDIQTDIRDNARGDMAVVLYRRAMMRIASRLGISRGAQALATGENLGQVASQTLTNLRCINEAATLPVLRPLLAYDKHETIALARRIETFETSILPHEDCCSLFVPKHPATRLPIELAEKAELGLDPSLLDAAVETVETERVVA